MSIDHVEIRKESLNVFLTLSPTKPVLLGKDAHGYDN